MHHALAHYRHTFPCDSHLNYLYVSVFPVERYCLGDERCRALRAFTRYVEALVYWEYARHFAKRPLLNLHKTKVVAACCSGKALS